MSSRGRLAAGALAALVLAGGAQAAPDFTGIYWSEGGFPDGIAGGGNPPVLSNRTPPPLKGKYLEDYRSHLESRRLGRPTGDPGATCYIGGFPRSMVVPYPIEVVQTEDQVVFHWEGGDRIKRVYLNQTQHPKDFPLQFSGHSIGRWDGEVLVVDTIGYRPETVLDPNGTGHSDRMHTIEWIWLAEDGQSLHHDIVFHDREAMTEPWIAKYLLRRRPDLEMREWSCEENNRNPVNERGETTTVVTDSH